MAGDEGFGHVPRPRNFTIANKVCIGKSPCELPFLAVLTPECSLGTSNPNHNQNKITTTRVDILFWLGMRESNPRMRGPEPRALPLGQSPKQMDFIVCKTCGYVDSGFWLTPACLFSQNGQDLTNLQQLSYFITP